VRALSFYPVASRNATYTVKCPCGWVTIRDAGVRDVKLPKPLNGGISGWSSRIFYCTPEAVERVWSASRKQYNVI
jgi:hypothetical protein